MKSKIHVEVLRENVERATLNISRHLQSKGEMIAFAVYENPCIQETVNDKIIVSYGILLESETELTGIKKLYFRKYDLSNRSLNDVRKQAFEELFDVLVGCFVTTAYTAPDELLKRLSTTRDGK